MKDGGHPIREAMSTLTGPGATHLSERFPIPGAVVAERLGMSRETALTVGHALAGITAHAKGVRLGIYAPPSNARARPQARDLCGLRRPEGR